jgi:hypothetical protein
MSGLVAGRNQLGGHPAIVTVPAGEGVVVLFGVRTLHRNQTQGSFALAWNAILNWNQLRTESAEPTVADSDAGTHHH